MITFNSGLRTANSFKCPIRMSVAKLRSLRFVEDNGVILLSKSWSSIASRSKLLFVMYFKMVLEHATSSKMNVVSNLIANLDIHLTCNTIGERYPHGEAVRKLSTFFDAESIQKDE